MIRVEWFYLGVCFPYSGFVVAKTAPAWLLGIAVVVLAVIAGTGRLGHGRGETSTTPAERERLAGRFGGRLFLPVLAIPVITALFATLGPEVSAGGSPLLLAVLGLVFATAGVGNAIGHSVSAVLPRGALFPPSSSTASGWPSSR